MRKIFDGFSISATFSLICEMGTWEFKPATSLTTKIEISKNGSSGLVLLQQMFLFFFKVHMCESELVLDRFLFILSPLADRRSRARSLHHCSSYQAQGSVCTRVCVHMCVDSVCLCDKMTFQPVRRHVLTCPQPKTQSVKFPWPQLHAVQKCKHMNTFSFCAASYFLAFVSCWSIFFLFILFSKLLYSSVFTCKKKERCVVQQEFWCLQSSCIN